MLPDKRKVLASLDAEAANPMGLSMMVLISINLNQEEEAQKWFNEVKRQPRIDKELRNGLVSFFEKAFGRKPE